MLVVIKRFIGRLEQGASTANAPKDELALAIAVLLAKAGAMDGTFDAKERELVKQRLVARYGVSETEIECHMAEAEKSADEAVEVYKLTKTLRDHLDEEGRIEFMEALWEIVYADGVLDAYEAQLMRRMAGLLYVPDRESAEARSRALEKLGLDDRTGSK